MLKGFNIIFTAIVSMIIFKKQYSNKQITGLFLVLLGLTLVGVSNIDTHNLKGTN